jgi:hypothetical protein
MKWMPHQLIQFKLIWRLFFVLTIAFIAVTAIGTVLHEAGHFLAGKLTGAQPTIHYASVSYQRTSLFMKTSDRQAQKDTVRKRLIRTAGGPIQTFLTSLLGLGILTWRKIKKHHEKWIFIDWTAIFMALFSLRFVFNFITGTLSGAGRSDEIGICRILGWPPRSLGFVLFLIGFISALWVLFKILPTEQRFTFIFAGFVGAGIGYPLWMNVLGPILLP